MNRRSLDDRNASRIGSGTSRSSDGVEADAAPAEAAESEVTVEPARIESPDVDSSEGERGERVVSSRELVGLESVVDAPGSCDGAAEEPVGLAS